MWTNNFKKWSRALFSRGVYQFMRIDGTASQLIFATIPGEIYNLGEFMSEAKCEEPTVSEYTSAGVYFGSGSTPATVDDYKLEAMITSGLEITNQGLTLSEEGAERYSATAGYLLQNTTDEAIVINEVGMLGTLAGKASTSTTTINYRNCLLERQVLPKSVIIAPGETKFVTYKLTFNQILNVE